MKLYARTPTLGSVHYSGQRGFIVTALTNQKSAIPNPFTRDEVVAALDPVAYEKTFTYGTMVVTIEASVQHHLRELVRLGQLEKLDRASVERETSPAKPTGITSEPTQLLAEWAKWEPGSAPFVLGADRDMLESTESTVNFASWSDAISAPDFGRAGDPRLHLGLLPQPFIGDLRQASIYVLSLNPGLEPTDYFGEYEVAEYRKALLDNLKQQFGATARPFIFLDPCYSWHGGFRWWNRKLYQVINQLAVNRAVSLSSAREAFAKEIASIELLPYHSSVFSDPGGRLQNLPSVALAKSFVRNFVLPRVEGGEAIAIVLRKAAVWGLPASSGVIRYGGAAARGAHLSLASAGGRAILEHLQAMRA